MDAIEHYVADLVTKALHGQAPALTPADDAKVAKLIHDAAVVAMDVAAVYFALRAARKI